MQRTKNCGDEYYGTIDTYLHRIAEAIAKGVNDALIERSIVMPETRMEAEDAADPAAPWQT